MASDVCSRVLCEHPDGLVTKIMAWLSIAELGRCMRTCKDWNASSSNCDDLWWALCSSRWSNAKIGDGPWHRRWATVLGPMRVASGPRPSECARPVLIACPPKWALPSSKEEEEAAESSWWVRPSSLAEVLTWRGSLMASVLDLKRSQITDQELAGSTWALRFRLPPGANTAYVLGAFFRKDRKFIDAAIFPAEMPSLWSIQVKKNDIIRGRCVKCKFSLSHEMYII